MYTPIHKVGSVSADLNTGFLECEMQFDDFELTYFFDFCSALEVCVLHDHIYDINSSTNSFLYLDNPFTKQLFNDNVISIVDLNDNDFVFNQSISKELQNTIPMGLKFEEMDYWNESFANVGRSCYYAVLEEFSNIPHIPNFHTAPSFIYANSLKSEHLLANEIYYKLNEHYSNTKSELLNLRRTLDGENFIQIPPISFEILQKASSYDKIPELLLEYRHKYHSLRKRFMELEELLLSDDISLKKKAREKSKLFKTLSHFDNNLRRESAFVLTSIASKTNEIGNLSDVIEGAVDVGSIRWTKLVDFIIKEAEKLVLKFKLRPLYTTTNNYLNASSAEIKTVVQRHFGREISQRDFEFVNGYSMFVKNGINAISEKQNSSN